VSGGHANPKKQANSIVQREIDLRETAKALAEDQKLSTTSSGSRATP
jgi:hypothetical protein